MGSPYREIVKVDTAPAKSGKLLYRPLERNDRIAAGSGAFRLVVPPLVAALLVGAFLGSWAGSAAFVVLLGLSIASSRARPKDVVVLSVFEGELHVFPMGSNKANFSVRLDELDDVVLETKAVERVLDAGANLVNIGIGPTSPTIAATSETKRIALESPKGVHVLTTEFFGHSDTTESFAKVRTFLRSMGWTPLSEREEEDD